MGHHAVAPITDLFLHCSNHSTHEQLVMHRTLLCTHTGQRTRQRDMHRPVLCTLPGHRACVIHLLCRRGGSLL
jgi:hypothetical protein